MNGEGNLLARAKLVGHCLLLETPAHGLVLVDTGIGVEDVGDTRRLGALAHLHLFDPAVLLDVNGFHVGLSSADADGRN